MADQTTQQQPEPQDDAQALASAKAGYDRATRGANKPPVETSSTASPALPLADSVQTPPESTTPPVSEEPDLEAAAPAAPDPVKEVSDQLEALRNQVKELTTGGGGAAAEVRKLHGEIGNINRTLKQLQAKPGDAPADEDELAAALKKAEKVAEEFPEIAGPLVAALKAAAARSAPAPAKEPEPAAASPGTTEAQPIDIEAERQKVRQQAAIDAINELHPDRLAINQSPEFKAWLAAKPPEYQKKVTSTWNPAVLSPMYDEFKASRTARKSRQERLDAATQPQGTGTGGPSTLPDEAGFSRGYERAAKQRRF